MRRSLDIASELGEFIVWLGWRIRGPRRLPPNGRTMEQAERTIVSRRFETAYVFDQDGRQLFRQEGRQEYLAFAVADLPLLKDSVLIHNHPPDRQFRPEDPRFDGGGISRMDLDFAVQHDLAELRVLTVRRRFVAVRPVGGWPIDADTISALFMDVAAEVAQEDGAAIAAGDLTVAEAEGRRTDEVIRRVAAIVGFAYRQERNSPGGARD